MAKRLWNRIVGVGNRSGGVRNLQSILALPLDALPDYLALLPTLEDEGESAQESEVLNDAAFEEVMELLSKDIRFEPVSKPLSPLLGDRKEELGQLPFADSSLMGYSDETGALATILVILLAGVAIFFIFRQGRIFVSRSSKLSEKGELCTPSTEYLPPQDTKETPKSVEDQLRSSPRKQKHESQEGRASTSFEQERIDNLRIQNAFLQNALQEQRDIVKHVLQELQIRDEHTANMEKSQNKAIDDLAERLQTLSGKSHASFVQQAISAEDYGTLKQQLEDLIMRMDGRDHQDNGAKSEEKGGLIQEDLEIQLKKLHDTLDQKGRERADQLETQVSSLSLKLEATDKELRDSRIQITNLGPYLKAREEKDSTQISKLQGKCEILMTKVQQLLECHARQQVFATSLQQEIAVQGEKTSTSLASLQTKLQDQGSSHEKQIQHVQALCNSLNLHQKGLLQSVQTAESSVTECCANQMEASTQIHTLQTQCASQEHQLSSMLHQLTTVAKDLQSQSLCQRDLQINLETHEERVATDLESLLKKVEGIAESQHSNQSNFNEQICEFASQVQSLQGQEVASKKMHESIQNQLIETTGGIKSLKLDFRKEMLQQKEEHRVAIEKKEQQVTNEVQERLKAEIQSVQVDLTNQIERLREGLADTKRMKQSGLSVPVERWESWQVSKAQEMLEVVEKCKAEYQVLQDNHHLMFSNISSLQATVCQGEANCAKIVQDNASILSKLKDISINENEAAKKVDSLEQQHKDAKQVFSNKIESIEAKLALVDQHFLDVSQNTQTTKNVLNSLSDQADDYNCRLIEIEEQVESGVLSLQEDVTRLDKELQVRDELQHEKFLQINLQSDSLEGKLNEMCSVVSVIRKETKCMKENQTNIKANMDLKVDSVNNQQRREDFSVTENTDTVSESESLEHLDQLDDGHVESIENSTTFPEKKYGLLSTKLISFQNELQIRADSVASLEEHVKERSDSFLSKTEVLTNEIELQRNQSKKWSEMIQKNTAQMKDKKDQCTILAVNIERYQNEIKRHCERISEFQHAMNEDGTSPVLEAFLGNKIRIQREQLEQWKEKAVDTKEKLSECETEHSKLVAKQELYNGELQRRQTHLKDLRARLRSLSSTVGAEREALETKLSFCRKERDTWREKTDALSRSLVESKASNTVDVAALSIEPEGQCLRKVAKSGEQTPVLENTAHAEQGHDIPNYRDDLKAKRRQSMQKFTDSIATLRHQLDDSSMEISTEPVGSASEGEGAIVDIVKALKLQVEGLVRSEGHQRAQFIEYTEAIGNQGKTTQDYCQTIADRIDRINEELETKKNLCAELEELQNEVSKQKCHFEETQAKLKADLSVQGESIQALEEFQASAVTILKGQKYTSGVLLEQVESMRDNLRDRGDRAARIEALAKAIKRCEDRFVSMSTGLVPVDTTNSIDALKTGLKTLRCDLEGRCDTQDTAFSGLLSKVEKTMDDVGYQGTKLENFEVALHDIDDLREHLANCLQDTTEKADGQAKRILEAMNEKYIDLSSRIDLLSAEVNENGEESANLKGALKDRESLYLTQTNAARMDLMICQARLQHETQARIDHTMTQLYQYLVRQVHSSRFLTWNASEERLAFYQCKNPRADQNKAKSLKLLAAYPISPQHTARVSTTGYSMASGIVVNNMFVPAMVTPMRKAKADALVIGD